MISKFLTVLCNQYHYKMEKCIMYVKSPRKLIFKEFSFKKMDKNMCFIVILVLCMYYSCDIHIIYCFKSFYTYLIRISNSDPQFYLSTYNQLLQFSWFIVVGTHNS